MRGCRPSCENLSPEFKRCFRYVVLEAQHNGWHWEQLAHKTAEIRTETLYHQSRFKIFEFRELTSKLLWLLLSALTFLTLFFFFFSWGKAYSSNPIGLLSEHCSGQNYEMWSQIDLGSSFSCHFLAQWTVSISLITLNLNFFMYKFLPYKIITSIVNTLN